MAPLLNPAGNFLIAVAALIAYAALRHGADYHALKAFLERDSAIRSQPFWLQGVEVLLIAEFCNYWTHRAFHRVPFLWRFHAVHHSSQRLDWLSSVRVHPVNDFAMKLLPAAIVLPLGFDFTAFAAAGPFFAFYAVMLHANVRWNFGPVGRIVASPVFHRWHHTTEQDGQNRNFAGLFPWLDRLFGTHYMPPGRQPERFGTPGAPVPAGFLRQLAWPFRKQATVTLA